VSRDGGRNMRSNRSFDMDARRNVALSARLSRASHLQR
jgi:hypothetical protein